jgi:putative methanogenesis marker protein 8
MTIVIGIKDNTSWEYQSFDCSGAFKMPEDEHVMEAIGKARVVVKNGKVVEVGAPSITQCPLAKRFKKPVTSFDRDSIRANIEERIRTEGMFTKDRQLISFDDFVPFGASELIATGLSIGLIEAAVIAADGAGTVVVTNPGLAQGIGGKMSGLVKTSPIKEVINGIEKNGGCVLDPLSASIDQQRGMAFAKELGYLRVAVTVTNPLDAEAIRAKYPETLIIGVHMTGISKEGAELMVANSDLVAGCASKWIRETAGKVALLQAGVSIPIYALSKRGKDLIAEKIKETRLKIFIKVERLPVQGDKEPKPLV